MNYTELARKRFSEDKFATDRTKIIIDEVDIDYAKCSLNIEECHLNANNTLMGGAIFTLADFAFAIASNIGGADTVSLNSHIDYISPPKGKKVVAETKCIKNGKKTCLFEIVVKDEDESLIAKVITTGYRLT